MFVNTGVCGILYALMKYLKWCDADSPERDAAVCSLIKSRYACGYHMGIALLRIGVSCLMLLHGTPKLIMLMQGQGVTWLNPLGIGSSLSLALCVFAEFFCSVAILFGFLTRLAALVLAFNFWVVAFVFDSEQAWETAELPLLYLICYVCLVCTGAGRWSLDGLLLRLCAVKAIKKS